MGESFVVDGMELGIDRQRSHFHVIGAGTGEVRLDAKIVGRLPFAIFVGTE